MFNEIKILEIEVHNATNEYLEKYDLLNKAQCEFNHAYEKLEYFKKELSKIKKENKKND